MKKLSTVLVLAAIFSCSKKDTVESLSGNVYQIRIAAVDNDGLRSYSPITRVKAGKVAIEFETAEVSNVKEYRVEASSDGLNFSPLKTIAADGQTPNRFYRDTVVLE